MHTKLLKTLAVFALGMITFPFLLTNDVLSFREINPLRIAAYYAVFLIVFAVGYALGQVTLRHRRLLLPSRILGGGMFFLSMILILFTENPAVIIACGVSAAFWYFLGERASRKHYADYFPMFMFGVYIAVTLICYLFYGAMAPEELKKPVQSAVIAAFMTELCLAALLVNQSGIYDKASRRRETKTMLPKGLSGYNAALVLVITLAGLGLYLFSDKIVWLLQSLIRLLFNLFMLLMSNYSDELEPVPGEQGELELSLGPATEWAPLTYLLAIVLIIIFRRQIWEFLKNLVRSIYNFFVREPEKSAEEPDFIDVLERTSHRRKTGAEQLSDSQLMKKYRAESSPAMKFRLGYRILLRKINRGGKKILPSDTTSQQYVKGRQVYGERLAEVAECYDSVRYNDETPSQEQMTTLNDIINI